MSTLSIDPSVYESARALPDHRRLMQNVLEYFFNVSAVEAAFVSGSTAAGQMDEFSDLDFGFLIKDQATREQLWSSRWDWNIAPWIHRFDADHIKPYFVIYFYEPSIHVDLNFYIQKDLPPVVGAPYKVAFDRTNKVHEWAKKQNCALTALKPSWDDAIHEDEQFWAWVHYACSHALRGEYYDVAYFIKDIRRIVERWEARRNGLVDFDTRKIESKLSEQFLNKMKLTFCKPDLREIQLAFETLMSVQLSQRSLLEKTLGVKWRTEEKAIKHMTEMVKKLST